MSATTAVFSPPVGSVQHALPLLRCGAGGTVKMVLMAPAPLSFGVHWVNRSYVCVGDGCPLCEHQRPRIANWILAKPMIGSKFGLLGLLEMSGVAWERLAGLLKMEGVQTPLGAYIEVSRKRANSPLICVPLCEPSVNLVPLDQERTLDALVVLLKLPPREPQELIPAWAERTRPLLANLAANAALVA